MLIRDVSELKPVRQRAIIINYNTKRVSFLALLSVLRYAEMPVLFIDCKSTDGSFDFFKSKLNYYDFDLLSAPLKKHGVTLNWLFSSLQDAQLLLVDSDLEVLNKDIFPILNEYIENERAFGCGFVNGPTILKEDSKDLKNALYPARPFIPFTLFKVRPVKEAIREGISFADVVERNEVYLFKKLKLKTPIFLKKRYLTYYPNTIYYDTGAKMYEHLKYEKFLLFPNIPEFQEYKYVKHYWGVTRRAIHPTDVAQATFINSMEEMVNDRLLTQYNEKCT